MRPTGEAKARRARRSIAAADARTVIARDRHKEAA
jgi:hypothetical protein